MKIKKILLYNFKNFKNTTVIDFSDNINFLVGPNGFGKSSIFDAIELGLTGELSRVKAKGKITPENITYNKPFFQNEQMRPVIIKLLLEKDDGRSLIIVRQFSSSFNGAKRDYAPQKSLSEFKLYRQEDVSEFSDTNASLSDLTQSEIDTFLDLNEQYKIKDIFNLFNYIQQEETTFFLKKSEQDRSNSLGFLLRTSEIENKISKMKSVKNAVNHSLTDIREQKEKLSVQTIQVNPYKRLFQNKNFPFDGEVPFTIDNVNRFLNPYKEEVQRIIEFKNNFQPEEYKKKLDRDGRIKNISNQNQQYSFYFLIMRKLFENVTLQWEKYILDNLWLFEYTLLENYIINFEMIEQQFFRRETLTNCLGVLNQDINSVTEDRLSDTLNEPVFSTDFTQLKNLLQQYKQYKEQATEIDKNLVELKGIRNELLATFTNSHQHIPDQHCPFCYSQFESFITLKKNYESYGTFLNQQASQNSQLLSSLREQLKRVVEQLKVKINSELDSLIITIDSELYQKISELRSYQNNQNIPRFKAFIQSYTTVKSYELGALNYTEFYQTYQTAYNEFHSKLKVEKNVYDEWFNIVNQESIKKQAEVLEQEYLEFNFDQFQLSPVTEKKITKESINQQLQTMQSNLYNYINQKYFVNEALINDPRNILGRYFDNDIRKLEDLKIQDLYEKQQYLEAQALLVKDEEYQHLSDKEITLDKTIEYLERILTVYEEEVRDYKINVIKLLRIPFFIYSAKILQNYQQGLGVFLTYKEGTETTDEKAVIKFKTDTNNDHDAMHQLSTGQLAVISLAFTLSLNTMFRLSNQLNFLMIDDPIQDMDSMNVLAFIEILRHSIIDKYQVILSTYSDQSALFMGYKFAKSDETLDIKYHNVRKLLE